jgi:hypothetical protein
MRRSITSLVGLFAAMFLVVACTATVNTVAEPSVPPQEPAVTDVSEAAPETVAAVLEVPVQTPFTCPDESATDATGTPLIRGCESITDIQSKYPGMDVLPNTVMMEYSAEATREGYYDSTITSGLSDLPTMCKFLQFHGDLYNGDQASLTAVGTGVDVLGPICATDNEYAQISVYTGTVSESLKKIGSTFLGLAEDDPIFAYETTNGLGYYVFWKLDPADGSRVIVSIISGGLGTR